MTSGSFWKSQIIWEKTPSELLPWTQPTAWSEVNLWSAKGSQSRFVHGKISSALQLACQQISVDDKHHAWVLIQVPVGRETLGRIMNVIGEPVDECGPIGELCCCRFCCVCLLCGLF